MLAEIALAIEQSGLGHAARSTLWLYPAANLLHVLGVALLVGGIAVFDVQVLRGRWDVADIGRSAIPVAATGLAIQVVSGAILFTAEASALIGNPAFWTKIAAMGLGLANVLLFHALYGRALRRDAAIRGARPLAAVSLLCWVVALIAGRAIAYV